MANSTTVWEGDASVTTQLDTLTIANTWAASDIITTTMTDENGGTSVENTTADGSDKETIRDKHLGELQANTNALFTAITWAASSTDKITATAKVPGTPFTLTASETTAGDGTWADAQTTPSSGPNDWGVAANSSGAAVPVDDDIVKITDGGVDILYGLNQAAIDLAALHIGEGYTGTIGQINNTYYLTIGVSHANETKPRCVVNARGNGVLLKAGNNPIDNLYVQGGRNTPDMLKLAGGTITNIYIEGSDVQGTITIANSTTLSRIECHDCPGVTMVIGESVASLANLFLSSGTHLIKTMDASTTDNWFVAGSAEVTFSKDASAATGTLTQLGGRITYQVPHTLGKLDLHAGEFIADSRDGVITFTTATQYGGNITERRGGHGVVWSGNIVQEGGTVVADKGKTQNLGT